MLDRSTSNYECGEGEEQEGRASFISERYGSTEGMIIVVKDQALVKWVSMIVTYS